MGSGRVNVVLLVEDAAHRRFLLALCREIGLQAVRTETAPAGVPHGPQGCAFVQKRFPEELDRVRRRGAARLIVMIDGDRFGVGSRLRLLNRMCTEYQTTVRQEQERVLILVPTWSVETWELWLCGANVEEETDYSESAQYRRLCSNAAALRTAVAAFARGPTRSGEAESVPSLFAGRAELRRLGPL